MLQIDAPNTFLLGVWLAEGRAALTGSLISEYGDTLPDVLNLAGEPWTTLVQALEQAAVMRSTGGCCTCWAVDGVGGSRRFR